MEFTSREQLYIFLIPAFNVKNRINRYYGYNIEYQDMWNFLVTTKWHKSNNLQLSDMVNDIITMDIYKLKRMMKI